MDDLDAESVGGNGTAVNNKRKNCLPNALLKCFFSHFPNRPIVCNDGLSHTNQIETEYRGCRDLRESGIKMNDQLKLIIGSNRTLSISRVRLLSCTDDVRCAAVVHVECVQNFIYRRGTSPFLDFLLNSCGRAYCRIQNRSDLNTRWLNGLKWEEERRNKKR